MATLPQLPLKLRALSLGARTIRTAATDPVIEKLDAYFFADKHPAVVTSILRTPEDQLRIIRSYAVSQKLLKLNEPLDFTSTIMFEDKEVPKWQLIWSQLLTRHVLINPVKRAYILTNYWKNGVNQKGTIRNPSNHFTGKCFDLGGSSGTLAAADDEYVIVRLAMKNPTIGIKSALLERENNCVHVEVV